MPYFYELLVRVPFNASTEPSYYNGHILIKFKCTANTSRLVFHMHDTIDIHNDSFELKSLSDPSLLPVKQLAWHYDKQRQFFVVDFSGKNGAMRFVEKSSYSISMGFRGQLRNDNAGFYKSSYLDASGKRRWLLTSQMEATDARKSFPCFDEPDMKAKFKIRVIHEANMNALSNMPVKSSKLM